MTPLEAAWEHYGGTLLTHREGRNKAKCPLHDDANASAVVNIKEQRWSCYAGCGYGDIYELVKLADGIDSFRECKELADRSFGTASTSRQPKKRARKKGWT
jgi:DNA primase